MLSLPSSALSAPLRFKDLENDLGSSRKLSQQSENFFGAGSQQSAAISISGFFDAIANQASTVNGWAEEAAPVNYAPHVGK